MMNADKIKREKDISVYAFFAPTIEDKKQNIERTSKKIEGLRKVLDSKDYMISRFNTILGFRNDYGKLTFVVSPDTERGLVMPHELDEHLAVPRYEPESGREWLKEAISESGLKGDEGYISSLEKTTLSERELAREVLSALSEVLQSDTAVVSMVENIKERVIEQENKEILNKMTAERRGEVANVLNAIISATKNNDSKDEVIGAIVNASIQRKEIEAVADQERDMWLSPEQYKLVAEGNKRLFDKMVDEKDMDSAVDMLSDTRNAIEDFESERTKELIADIIEKGKMDEAVKIFEKKSLGIDYLDKTSLSKGEAVNFMEDVAVLSEQRQNAYARAAKTENQASKIKGVKK